MQKIVRIDRFVADDLDSLPLGNILQRLAIVSPKDADAIKVIAIDRLRKVIAA